jgi:geranylgeranyl diphosphate synthase, type II
MDIQKYLNDKSKKIDLALTRSLPPATKASALRRAQHSGKLEEAMRYAVLGGGKRIRPALVLAASEAVGGKEESVMAAACALELLHSYSLVHDDLPCMDNDMMRRGKPSCHAKFGEVTALLAGDALLTRAFGILSSGGSAPDKRKVTALTWIAEAVGHQGMVSGQALDMEFQDKEMDLPTLEFINTRKTGELIAVSVRVGAFLGGGSPLEVKALHRYGRSVGLLFQLTDDIMDGQGYAKVIGPHDAREEALRLLAQAKKALSPLKSRGKTLAAIAEFIATRKN